MKKTKKLLVIGISTICLLASNISASAYNCINAANYAQNYAVYYNRNYKPLDSDCTNFTSQCLVAGGYSMNGTWHNWKSGLVWNVTNEFTRATYQKTYIQNAGWARVNATYRNPNSVPDYVAGLGTIIYYDWDGDGSVDHSSFTSSINGGTMTETCISQHTSDRLNVKWDLYQFMNASQRVSCKYTVMTIA